MASEVAGASGAFGRETKIARATTFLRDVLSESKPQETATVAVQEIPP